MLSSMARSTAFRVIGWGVFGLACLSFVLHVLWMIKSGHGGDTYYTYKFQPMTYWGAAAVLTMVALVGLVGIYYWLKRVVERRSDRTDH
jgi:hypothetical protein